MACQSARAWPLAFLVASYGVEMKMAVGSLC